MARGRRNPAAAALLVTALALAGLAVGGGFWLQRQHAERREETARREGEQSKAAEAVLEQAVALQKRAGGRRRGRCWRGPEPGGHPGSGGSPPRVGQALTDAYGDQVGGDPAPAAGRQSGTQRASPLCRGLPGVRDCPASAGAGRGGGQIRNSAIRETLLAFLHDWLFSWVWDSDKDQLRALLDRADDDDWRRRLRTTLHGAENPDEWQNLLRAREALTSRR